MTNLLNTKNRIFWIKLRHLIEYSIFLFARAVLEHLPISVASSASAFLWRTIAPHLRRHRRAEKNLRAAMPELTMSERKEILSNMWDNLGRTTAEAFQLNKIASKLEALELNFSLDAKHILESRQPAIFVSLHMGNWEVAAIAAERFNKTLMGIYKAAENPYVDRDVKRIRSRFYRGGLYTRSANTVSQITRGLKNGYSLAVMADLRDSHGETVQFFKLPARSTNFPALIARRYGLPIIAMRAIRTAPGRYRIDAEKLLLSITENSRLDIEQNSAQIQSHLEGWIREAPSLWMWGHRRWNLN